jgi:Domain of unknown function (DUF4184)
VPGSDGGSRRRTGSYAASTDAHQTTAETTVPFTGSHPAAVLPLARGRLALSALVIGSMAPDTPYYLPRSVQLGLDAHRTHSLLGAVGLDALISAVLWLCWHGLLARPALAAAPRRMQQRVPPDLLRPVSRRLAAPLDVMAIYAACVLGALTHVCWDAFTHRGRWGTDRVAWLRAEHAGLAGYSWAQYASGVVGAAVLLVALVRWWRRTPARADLRGGADPRRGRAVLASWGVIVSFGLVGAAAGAAQAAGTGSPSLARYLFYAVTRGTAAAGLAALAAAVSWHIRTARV